MKWGNKPVIVIGYGVRSSGVDPRPLLALGVPVLSSWQAMDILDNRHPAYYGRPGIYGQRTANRILYEADQVIAIGNRMTPWMIGHGGLRQDQQLLMLDVDKNEVKRFPNAIWLQEDVASFMLHTAPAEVPEWVASCNAWREQYPWVESPAHDDTNGYMNSYRIVGEIEKHLREDEVICVDVGSHMCSLFQSLHVSPPQRVINGGGLGEMGCGLPFAIGASFADNKREVLCLMGDGGMMINLQELQTIVHHQLPIKIIVFENDGYAMIKGTHKNVGVPYQGVNTASGLSMPDFMAIAAGFKINSCSVNTWETFHKRIQLLFQVKGPFIMVVHLDPEQDYVPRLKPIKIGNQYIPARFDQLSPILEQATKPIVEADIA